MKRLEDFIKWYIARPRSFARLKFGALTVLITAVFGAPWFLVLIGLVDQELAEAATDNGPAAWGTVIVFTAALIVDCILAYRRMVTQRQVMELMSSGTLTDADRDLLIRMYRSVL